MPWPQVSRAEAGLSRAGTPTLAELETLHEPAD